MSQLCDIDHFKGYWSALESHTTGLNILGEFAGHGQKFHTVFSQISEQTITPHHILAIYRSLIAKDKEATWRTSDEAELVSIANDKPDIYLDTAAPDQILPLLEKLLNWTDKELAEKKIHPLMIVAIFHVVFLQIKPFETSNQKLCSIFTQIFMFKAAYAYTPYVSLDSIIFKHVNEYYEAIKAYQDSLENNNPDWQSWLEFFLPLLKEQADVLYNKLQGEGKDLSHLPQLSARIMALFEQQPRLKMKEIIQQTGGRRATLKLRLGELLDKGYIKRHGGGRSTYYALS
jgi:Fic family protein